MLQQVCEHIHNYFIKDRHQGVHEIADGMISLPLLDGQRFLIIGSVLNDGIFTYHDTGIKNDDDTEVAGLQDETWAGTICALAVPPAVIALSEEIKRWVDEYGDVVNSPYTSENVIGVYSYTKAPKTIGNSGSGVGGAVTWQDVYKGKLDRWRRLAF